MKGRRQGCHGQEVVSADVVFVGMGVDSDLEGMVPQPLSKRRGRAARPGLVEEVLSAGTARTRREARLTMDLVFARQWEPTASRRTGWRL